MADINIETSGAFSMTLGEIIEMYRKRENLTQSDLAKLVGVSDRTVINYENNKTVPDVKTLVQIIKILDMPQNFKFREPIDDILILYCPKDKFELDENGMALCETKRIKSNFFRLYGCRKYDYSCVELNGHIYLLYNEVKLEKGNKALVRFAGSEYFVIAEFDGKCYTDVVTEAKTDKIDAIAARVLGEISEYEKIECEELGELKEFT